MKKIDVNLIEFNLVKNQVTMTIDEFKKLQTKATAYDTKEVQDAIECDRIERKLLSGCNRVYWHINDNEKMEFGGEYLLTIDDRVIPNRFMGKSKLEALTKALEWVEGENK
jgi:hypothetical protein